MKFRVFWDVASCSTVLLTDVSEVLTASVVRAMIEAVRTSETSINFLVYIGQQSPIFYEYHVKFMSLSPKVS
jgi:hypothetical protein